MPARRSLPAIRGSRSSAALRFGGGPMAIRVMGTGDAMTVSTRAWTPSFSTRPGYLARS